MTKILLVDDTATVLMAEKMMLSGNGFNIETAANGVEALDVVRVSPPDLILLDIVMPGMDGIQLLKEVRMLPERCDIPVIMVTTKGEQNKVQEAFSAGCDDYVTKPINKLLLMSKIKALVA